MSEPIKRITVKQFIELLQKQPQEAEIKYIDFSWADADDLVIRMDDDMLTIWG